jgi:hypothetical protein
MMMFLSVLLIIAAVAIPVACVPLIRERLRQIEGSYEYAEWQLDSAARSTRRQMNDAAGQSWRNLVE